MSLSQNNNIGGKLTHLAIQYVLIQSTIHSKLVTKSVCSNSTIILKSVQIAETCRVSYKCIHFQHKYIYRKIQKENITGKLT